MIVTHNVELARSMPRIVTLKDGRVHSDERRATPAKAEPLAVPAEG